MLMQVLVIFKTNYICLCLATFILPWLYVWLGISKKKLKKKIELISNSYIIFIYQHYTLFTLLNCLFEINVNFLYYAKSVGFTSVAVDGCCVVFSKRFLLKNFGRSFFISITLFPFQNSLGYNKTKILLFLKRQ